MNRKNDKSNKFFSATYKFELLKLPIIWFSKLHQTRECRCSGLISKYQCTRSTFNLWLSDENFPLLALRLFTFPCFSVTSSRSSALPQTPTTTSVWRSYEKIGDCEQPYSHFKPWLHLRKVVLSKYSLEIVYPFYSIRCSINIILLVTVR